jgi:hypothetical protein
LKAKLRKKGTHENCNPWHRHGRQRHRHETRSTQASGCDGFAHCKHDAGQGWLRSVGGKAQIGTFADAAAFGEIVFDCTNGANSLAALRQRVNSASTSTSVLNRQRRSL